MTNPALNLCIRCGKPRKVVKTWKESIKGAITIFTSTACPDAACQKKVDRKLALQKEKRESLEKERIQRAFAHKRQALTS
jgi:hypothetical protein